MAPVPPSDGSESRPYPPRPYLSELKSYREFGFAFPSASAPMFANPSDVKPAMSLSQRRWLRHTPPAWTRDATFFITLCCRARGANQLCTPEVAGKLFTAVQHYHDQLRWHVPLWLLMPDHLHALVSCPCDEDLAKAVAAWKRFTAGDTGTVWQKGFFDHRLRRDESFEEKANYIRMNPVRKGLIADPGAWPYVWTPETRRIG